ncbi:MAG: YciI family protein [Flavobacteriaceae bacterium]|nr:YciI family protein [Flavobacteriaceae bacterium]
MKTKATFVLVFLFILGSKAQTVSDLTIVFKAQAKVNVLKSERNAIKSFWGATLGRKIESEENADLVHFDGGGFVKFVYRPKTEVLDSSQYHKSMQLALLVPSSEYGAILSVIKDFGAADLLPNVEKYQDHTNDYYFHAPGGQVFRMVNSVDTFPKSGEGYVYDADRASKYGADDYGMKKYIFAFLKRGPNRDIPKEEAAQLQNAHLQNIMRLAQEGKLILAGPFFGNEDLRGIYIFDVETLEEAKSLTETDPAIQAGSLAMELKEWYGSAALMEVTKIGMALQKKSITD